MTRGIIAIYIITICAFHDTAIMVDTCIVFFIYVTWHHIINDIKPYHLEPLFLEIIKKLFKIRIEKML